MYITAADYTQCESFTYNGRFLFSLYPYFGCHVWGFPSICILLQNTSELLAKLRRDWDGEFDGSCVTSYEE
jgi:hypothetical protein